jgi:hypothetical protein
MHGDVHLVIDMVKGTREQQARFHHLCYHVDPNWPFVGGQMTQLHHKNRRCQKCRGRIYSRPQLLPTDIKAAARQCGVHVKVRQYSTYETCWPNGSEQVLYPDLRC